MEIKVNTVYLELTGKNQFIPKDGFRKRIEVREVENDIYINFTLFAGVGLPWKWYSRLDWTMEQWDAYFSSGKVKTFLGFKGNKIIGYYEIEEDEDQNVEIKFFGLFPGFLGSGLGGMFLSHAVDSAFGMNARRVWLHTCSNDSGSALKNYIDRGFKIFKEEEQVEYVPEKEEILKSISGFFERYISRFTKP
ncbi:MAG: GNAT family N-acetyltransferase [Bacteroidales bacterium]